MSMRVDLSDVRQLGRDLENAGHRADGEMRRIMRVGANKIKSGMRKDFRRAYPSHLPDVAGAINYDGGAFGGDIEYEIGVDRDAVGERADQGKLGNILAYGDGTRGPYVDHTAALHREVPIVEHHVADAGEKAPLGRLR